MITVDVLDPATDPEPADWTGFAAAEQLAVPWDYRLLAVEAASGPNPVLLALARADGALVAAVAAMVARRGRGPRWVEVFHQWTAGEVGWAFRGGLDPAARKEVLRAAERALCRHVGWTCAGLVYWSLSPPDVRLVAGRGRYVRQVVGNAVLENTFGSSDDWLASLSKNRRHSLRKGRRKLSRDSGLEVRFAAGISDLDCTDLAAMLRVHRAKFGRRKWHDSRNPVSPEYLSALLARPDVYTLTYTDPDGRVRAFSNVLGHPARLFHQHYAERPADEGGRGHMYFDAYWHVVQLMIELGAKAVSAGQGMAEEKARLGFDIRPLSLAVVPRAVAG